MGLTITQRPDQFNKFVASGNPILYKMSRKDFNITAVANSGGALQITVNANLATLAAALGGPVIAGSILWVQTDNGIYAGSYTVVTCTSAASSVITFTAGTYTAAATTGYVNLTSNRSGYNVEVELYRQADNTLIFSLLRFYPTGAGLLTMDVTILKDYITSEPLTNPTYGIVAAAGSLSSLRRVWRSSTGSLGFYIKYRETWTASAEAQTNDNAKPSWVVKGARQIGELYGGYLKEYSDVAARKFLTKFLTPKVYQDRITTLSFIEPTNPPSTADRILLKKEYYTSAGVLDFALYDLPGLTGADIASVYDFSADVGNLTQYLTYDRDFGAGAAWANLGSSASHPSVAVAAGATSKSYALPVNLKAGRTYTFSYGWAVAAGAGAETATIRFRAVRIDQTTVEATNSQAGLAQNTNGSNTFSFTPANETFWLFVDVIVSAGANARTVTLTNPNMAVQNLPKWVDFRLVTRHDTTKNELTGVSETLRHYFTPTPDQPVELLWKNSLGGASSHVFGFSQEYTYRYQDGKRKRMILFAENLTSADWEALNELNTSGEVYKSAFNELTTSINKSHARYGAQVYIVDAVGKLTGVIVIPTEVKTRSRKVEHNLQITIELPEVQEA